MDEPWFVYTRFLCWPCHWKGWLFFCGGILTVTIAEPILHAVLWPVHENLFVLAMMGILGTFWVIGSRHAEPL